MRVLFLTLMAAAYLCSALASITSGGSGKATIATPAATLSPPPAAKTSGPFKILTAPVPPSSTAPPLMFNRFPVKRQGCNCYNDQGFSVDCATWTGYRYTWGPPSNPCEGGPGEGGGGGGEGSGSGSVTVLVSNGAGTSSSAFLIQVMGYVLALWAFWRSTSLHHIVAPLEAVPSLKVNLHAMYFELILLATFILRFLSSRTIYASAHPVHHGRSSIGHRRAHLNLHVGDHASRGESRSRTSSMAAEDDLSGEDLPLDDQESRSQLVEHDGGHEASSGSAGSNVLSRNSTTSVSWLMALMGLILVLARLSPATALPQASSLTGPSTATPPAMTTTTYTTLISGSPVANVSIYSSCQGTPTALPLSSGPTSWASVSASSATSSWTTFTTTVNVTVGTTLDVTVSAAPPSSVMSSSSVIVSTSAMAQASSTISSLVSASTTSNSITTSTVDQITTSAPVVSPTVTSVPADVASVLTYTSVLYTMSCISDGSTVASQVWTTFATPAVFTEGGASPWMTSNATGITVGPCTPSNTTSTNSATSMGSTTTMPMLIPSGANFSAKTSTTGPSTTSVSSSPVMSSSVMATSSYDATQSSITSIYTIPPTTVSPITADSLIGTTGTFLCVGANCVPADSPGTSTIPSGESLVTSTLTMSVGPISTLGAMSSASTLGSTTWSTSDYTPVDKLAKRQDSATISTMTAACNSAFCADAATADLSDTIIWPAYATQVVTTLTYEVGPQWTYQDPLIPSSTPAPATPFNIPTSAMPPPPTVPGPFTPLVTTMWDGEILTCNAGNEIATSYDKDWAVMGFYCTDLVQKVPTVQGRGIASSSTSSLPRTGTDLISSFRISQPTTVEQLEHSPSRPSPTTLPRTGTYIPSLSSTSTPSALLSALEAANLPYLSPTSLPRTGTYTISSFALARTKSSPPTTTTTTTSLPRTGTDLITSFRPATTLAARQRETLTYESCPPSGNECVQYSPTWTPEPVPNGAGAGAVAKIPTPPECPHGNGGARLGVGLGVLALVFLWV